MRKLKIQEIRRGKGRRLGIGRRRKRKRRCAMLAVASMT
jgi:hypothetical protein